MTSKPFRNHYYLKLKSTYKYSQNVKFSGYLIKKNAKEKPLAAYEANHSKIIEFELLNRTHYSVRDTKPSIKGSIAPCTTAFFLMGIIYWGDESKLNCRDASRSEFVYGRYWMADIVQAVWK